MAAHFGKDQKNRRCLIVAACTLHLSASGRDEYAPYVRLRLVLWTTRKLARPVGAS